MWGKSWGRRLFALGAVGVAVGIWLFAWLGLSKGDQVASIVSAFVGVLGLGVSTAGLVTARRQESSRPAQSIENSSLGGNAEVVRNVRGKLTSHHPAVPATATSLPSSPSGAVPRSRPTPSEVAEQHIVDSRILGSARYIDNIDRDVETDK